MVASQKQEKSISKSQAIDTGMAMVLISLLVYLASDMQMFLYAAVALLLMNMIWPKIYTPVAIIWLGFSAVLGTFMAKVVMTLIFVIIVTPIAVLRRILGGDSLQLKNWKAGRGSVFTEKNHKYSTEDISKPY